ncbi:D-aminoacid aminotransferase-like PLP-dependent enzyme [Neocallimastix californiae]|uniref:D-aminoacid aminotransferase-like PLP-dependent enzyme n=1 Tax=Neocallimastix californiae TaxID=1754190 RepID=A0A1Y2DDL2_9FUNG|nr:D-aminoacid aminotransferase-like PLP-dependent enzyme [Neocallimastix californiae]|eukprot:ORY57361.1 D-aminoacid aminotransferase-like PLP-dependent enzyme [Neocallimastix californiae]
MGVHIYLKNSGDTTTIEKSEDGNKLEIKNYPLGVYTTARTWQRKSIYDFQGHINRLVYGLNNIRYVQNHEEFQNSDKEIVESEEISKVMEPLRDTEKFTVLIKKLIQMGMFTVPEIYIHICELPIQKSDTISVGSALLQRHNAKVKYSQWAKDRASYEEQLVEKNLNEIVMYDSDGNLYEGLSSNFYIYYNDTIYIAPEDAVLEGTIGKMVFKGCKEMNIPVRREFPKIKDIKKWAGAFITSTSRLVLPITKFYYNNELYELPVDATIVTIKQYVSEEIKNASIYVFPEMF